MTGVRAIMALVAVAVAGIGLAAQSAAGAPASALAIQGAGVVIGAVIAIGLAVSGRRPGRRTAMVLIAASAAAVAATFTQSGGEVHRWVSLGPVTVQPSMIVLPFAIWGWSAARADATLAVVTAGLAILLAVQPDAAASGGLLLALIGVAAARRSVSMAEGAVLAIALLGLIWAATRPDDLPAVAHVERVVVEALRANVPIGAAAIVAATAVPGLILWRARSARRDDIAIVGGLAGLWAGLAIAAVLANYPSPVVGYSASAVIGWLATLGLCAGRRTVSDPARG